jgi:SAM-dependent methyltransferase
VTDRPPHGKLDQYRGKAAGWSDREYADGRFYLERRAEAIATLGPPLRPGDTVLDLACGDGGLGEHLEARGLLYLGADLMPEMVDAARSRLGAEARIEQGDLNTYAPDTMVDATTLFRSLYYADDRRAFFTRAAGYTRTKLVFDLNPRQYALDDVISDLRVAGFERVATRAFFVPQRVGLPRPALRVLQALETTGPLARLALRFRFTLVVAAWRSAEPAIQSTSFS